MGEGPGMISTRVCLKGWCSYKALIAYTYCMPRSRFLQSTVISIASDEYPVGRGQNTEGKIGQPCGPRITRNYAAMVSWLLTGSPPWFGPHLGVALERCDLPGAAGDAGLDAALHARRAERTADGGVVSVPRVLHGSP